jgi:hypothetical protein
MLPNWHLSHDIIRHAPDEMRAGSVDMASIEKIWSYDMKYVANRLAGVLAIKDTYFLRSFIPGSTISSS